MHWESFQYPQPYPGCDQFGKLWLSFPSFIWMSLGPTEVKLSTLKWKQDQHQTPCDDQATEITCQHYEPLNNHTANVLNVAQYDYNGHK